MTTFVYDALPMRVAFGAGSLARLADELDHLGLRRVLVLCTPEQRPLAERVAAALGDRSAGVFAGAVMHVPVEVAATASAEAERLGADGCVAVGGGSTVGLGKAIALRHRIPVVAVPTTYAGSEMTPVWGLTEDGVKKTGRDPAVLPASVVYDPELTLTLPVGLSVTSAVNALAHAAEALYAPDASPIVALMAQEGVRLVAAGLPGVVAHPEDVDARSAVLQGAWLCGSVLGATTMSLHHKLCHVLGGTFDLPHAAVHTVVLPHALGYVLSAAPDADAALRSALGTDDVPGELFDLATRLGAPTSLAELGMRADGLAEVVRQVLDLPYASPREVTRTGLESLLGDAFQGRRPSVS